MRSKTNKRLESLITDDIKLKVATNVEIYLEALRRLEKKKEK